MVDLPRTANHEIAIAAAGPAVSVMLGGIGLGLGAVLHAPLIATFGWINLILAAFNLIPALPMDGGRILRAALSRRMSFVRATDLAVKVARVVAVGFALIGLTQGAFQLLVLSPFLWMMGTRELAMARMIGNPYQRSGGVEVLGRDAWEHRRRGDGFGGPERRYRMRQVGGRLVIELID
jgi:Zn-dependent protease